MQNPIITGILIAALAIPAAASAQTSEGRELAKLSFASLDRAGRGSVDQSEFLRFGSDVFYSMDYDENDLLTLEEFLSWGFGMEQAAERAGRADAYETAMRVVFAFWDRDGDSKITRSELRRSLMADFRRADADEDAFLTEDEYLYGFSINIAARAAINPPPAQ